MNSYSFIIADGVDYYIRLFASSAKNSLRGAPIALIYLGSGGKFNSGITSHSVWSELLSNFGMILWLID